MTIPLRGIFYVAMAFLAGSLLIGYPLSIPKTPHHE